MVLKRLKCSCPSNRKIDACMRKGKKVSEWQQNKEINMYWYSVPKLIIIREGIAPMPS